MVELRKNPFVPRLAQVCVINSCLWDWPGHINASVIDGIRFKFDQRVNYKVCGKCGGSEN